MEYETNTTVTETHVQTDLRWDPSYVKSQPGIVKLVAIVINLIGFICIMSSTPYYRETVTGEWFTFVCMTAFWVTAALLLMYLFHVIEKFHVIPWLMIEFGFCALWTFFYFTASIACAVEGSRSAAFAAAAFFGFVGMILYGYDSFMKFKGWRAGQLAQGDRKVTQTGSSQVTSPTPNF
jgi:hypothetical protein